MMGFQTSRIRPSGARSVRSILIMNAELQSAAKERTSDRGVEGGNVKRDQLSMGSASQSGPIWQHLRRYWWVILIAFAFGMVSTVYFAKSQPATFRAKATLVVVPIEGLASTREVVDSLNTLDRRSIVATYALLPSSSTVRERARSQLRLSQAQLQPYEVRTAVVPDTNALEVTAEGPNARVAAALAYAVADQTVVFTRNFYAVYAMKVLDWPRVPGKPVGPGLLRQLIAGAILSLLLGIGAAIVLGSARAETLFSRLGRSMHGAKRSAPEPGNADDVSEQEDLERDLAAEPD